MEKRYLIILAALVSVLALLMVVFFSSAGRGHFNRKERGAYLGDSGSHLSDRDMIPVTVFFVSEKDGLLYPEEREIFDASHINTLARQVIQELLKGSLNGLISPFPPETKLRELYVTEEGTAYVDFTKEIKENHLNGSTADISTVYCIVNSLTQNFESIRNVFILIDGGEKETLGGHIDLSRPFVPRKDLIAR
jgi:germination protein M